MREQWKKKKFEDKFEDKLVYFLYRLFVITTVIKQQKPLKQIVLKVFYIFLICYKNALLKKHKF
ncbi:hypothetical protein COK01_09300 [Priestia megaterium]|nr:hypothetical protein CN270_15670 [Priestia megaterium]PFP49791.1 hypothetical protein COK01_09300 [Priestia megaterium]PGX19457.1 hypothetical protein COE08_08505 [Priestia megaterium]